MVAEYDPWADCPRPPRRWQREALTELGKAWRAGERPVIRAVTGSGKAQAISQVCAMMARRGEVVIVSAPRQTLVEQLSGFTDPEPGSVRWRMGERVGIFYGGQKKGLDRDVIVTCNPSLPALVVELAGRPCRALIVDECHRSETTEFVAGIKLLAPKLIAGFSATPWRTSKSESLSIFTREVYTYGLRDAIREGVLVDWDEVGDEDGGNDANDVTLALIKKHADGPGIVSAKNIADAVAYAGILTSQGVPAAEIHSQLARGDQKQRIARLKAGELRCLVHVALLQEGVDLPWLRWLAMRRPNASAIRYFQELGRVLRSYPGKGNALLIDPYNHSDSFGWDHESAIGEIEKAMEEEARASEICATCGKTFQPRPTQYAPYVCWACKPEIPADEEPLPPTIAKSQICLWARRALVALVDAGLAQAPFRGSSWRSAWPTDQQLTVLRKIGGAEARAILPHASILRRGEVSDMIAFLSALRAAQRAHAKLPPLPGVPAHALRSLEQRR